MISLGRLFRSTRGSAAAELALVTPLLLIIMMGSVELGNFFMDEHILVKAVRDGARFAGRQPFANFACGGTPGGTVATDTQTIVMTGLLSGGSNKLAGITPSMISVTQSCSNAGTTLSGIYEGMVSGGPVVTVTATVPYVPVLQSFGFTGTGFNLYASQQAAVMGL
ncbi:MAG: TadE/TadG family type IV pilus assembly protein [Sphingomicrobium sp.]